MPTQGTISFQFLIDGRGRLDLTFSQAITDFGGPADFIVRIKNLTDNVYLTLPTAEIVAFGWYNNGIFRLNENTPTSAAYIYFSASNFVTGKQYQAELLSLTGRDALSDPDVTFASPTSTPVFFCLFEDTEVLTPSGYVSVKSLQEGDLVTTSDGRTSHIKRIWSSYMPLQEQFFPIVIKVNSIAENYPQQDCRLSKYHLINFNGNWITPYKNEHIFKYDREVKSIKYYHLELENYMTDHLVINGGLVVESLGNENKESGLEWEDRVNNSIIL